MGTVFKKGMKVYDQLIFPDKEGIVLTTNYIPENLFDEKDFNENYVHPYPIEVEFGSETMLYTSDGNSGVCDVKTLSTKPYKVEFQGFEQKESIPKFYYVWAETKEVFESKIFEDNYYGYPSQELAEASEALRRLLFLRDYYNEGWQPNWDDDTVKHTIETCCNDEFVIEPSSTNYPRVLSFKSKKIRNRFFEEQKELLEIARPLL
ncbi:hypothetical protein [Capnocytophaga sputigena]|uniref:hypothetical protein n=1 Tax=Capnocytophaga sputigena TaxID=1019 RepID=UPI0028D35AA8|nr:hypothetical protein [Capnocytophaga sputigena]